MPKKLENPIPELKNQKSKQVSVGPYGYVKQLLFGGQLPDMYAQDWPELQQSWATTGVEMPKESAQVRRVRPMSLLERAFNSDSYAKTTPFGNILLNKELINSEGQDLNNILTHELTHVGQGKTAFLKKYFGGQAQELENEAVNREAMRKTRTKDIDLPAIRGSQR